MKHFIALLFLWLGVTVSAAAQTIKINVNASKPLGPMKPIWAWIGHDEPNYTYSAEGRQLLSSLSRAGKIRFHDRTHNLLTSGDGSPSLKWGSTGVYSLDANGRPVYRWAILDKIFDTYRATRTIPYVEIGFMPKALSTHPSPYRHHWPNGPLFTGWSYPPKSYQAWSELVYRLVRHLVKRYGARRVEGWEFEVWNEPDIPYWHGTFQEYCKLYDYTAAAVKRALPNARVGGPATTSPQYPRAAAFLRNFLAHCLNGTNYATGKTGAPLDFISFHAKGSTTFTNGRVEMDIGRQLRDIRSGFEIIASFPSLRNLPVVISESDPEPCAACAAAIHPKEDYRYTSQYGSYEAELLRDTLALAARYHIHLQGAVTWAFVFPGQPYFEGYRALETHGIALPILNTFRLFAQLTGERVAVSSSGVIGTDQILQSSVRAAPDIDAMATRGSKSLNIFVWNYDDVSQPSSSAEIKLDIADLPKSAKRVLVERFAVDRNHENPYALWRAMGSPQAPTPAQYNRLKAAARLEPVSAPKWEGVRETKVALRLAEPSEGVALIKLKW